MAQNYDYYKCNNMPFTLGVFLPATSLYTYNSLLTIKSIKTPELFLVFVWSVGGHYSLHYSLR